MTGMRVVFWGTADLGKPRTRILLKGLRQQGFVTAECLYDIWRGVEDKSQVKGVLVRLRIILNHLVGYVVLISRYLRAPKHEAVFVAYMGHFDILVLWPFAKIRGAKIIWDAFLSLYDTVVDDRQLVRANGFRANLLRSFEKLVGAAADIVLLDTQAHAEFFEKTFDIPQEKLRSVWVGAEDIFFHENARLAQANPDQFNILFYGQFIPLHGIEHIVEAANLIRDPSVRWTIVGSGQERPAIDRLIAENGITSINLVDWIEYEELPGAIAKADICLGVFGTSGKAGRVIPNKVFQIFAAGKPLITRDSPAMREIAGPETPGLWLVKPGSGEAIAQAVTEAREWLGAQINGDLYPNIRKNINEDAIAQRFAAQLQA